jgi:hypothetical protein
METLTGLRSMAEFTPELFEPLTGQALTFLRPAGPDGARVAVQLDLVRVTISAATLPPGFRRQFSAIFALRGAAPLDDRYLHALSHLGFELCDVLLSRVAVPGLEPHDVAIFYEMVIG